jgi:hypothetical protein
VVYTLVDDFEGRLGRFLSRFLSEPDQRIAKGETQANA